MWALQRTSSSNLTLIRAFGERKRVAYPNKQTWNLEDRHCYQIKAGDDSKTGCSDSMGKVIIKLGISDQNAQIWWCKEVPSLKCCWSKRTSLHKPPINYWKRTSKLASSTRLRKNWNITTSIAIYVLKSRTCLANLKIKLSRIWIIKVVSYSGKGQRN